MSPNGSGNSPTDPFTAFWVEWARWATPPGTPPPAPSSESVSHMRKVFFDLLAGQTDQFMRSEVFLNSMKQTIDSTLAWQKMMNDTLQKGLAAAQVPSRADSEHLVTLVRGMEDRLERKLDDLINRVGQLERQHQLPASQTDPS